MPAVLPSETDKKVNGQVNNSETLSKTESAFLNLPIFF